MSRVPTTRYSDIPTPFVLTEASVKKINEALSKFGDTVTYRVDCADELERTFDLKKLLAYENAPKKAIKAVTIEAKREQVDDFRIATVRLRNEWFRTPVDLSFRGPESEVEKLNGAIESILAGMRPWYWWVARYSLLSIVLILTLTLSFVVMVVALTRRLVVANPPGQAIGTAAGMEIMTYTLAAAELMFVVVFALDWFKGRLFPRAIFAIGQGLTRHIFWEKIRWTVLIGFLVSLAASLAVLVFQRH